MRALLAALLQAAGALGAVAWVALVFGWPGLVFALSVACLAAGLLLEYGRS